MIGTLLSPPKAMKHNFLIFCTLVTALGAANARNKTPKLKLDKTSLLPTHELSRRFRFADGDTDGDPPKPCTPGMVVKSGESCMCGTETCAEMKVCESDACREPTEDEKAGHDLIGHIGSSFGGGSKPEAPPCVEGEAVAKGKECICSEVKPEGSGDDGGLRGILTSTASSIGDGPDGKPVSRVCRLGSLCKPGLPVYCIPQCKWGEPLGQGKCVCGYLSKVEVCKQIGDTCDTTTLADPVCHPKKCEIGKILLEDEKCACGVVGDVTDCEGEGKVCKGEKESPDKPICRDPDVEEVI